MGLEKRSCVKRSGQTGICPFVAVKRKHARPAGVEPPIIPAHRVRKEHSVARLLESMRNLPALLSVLHKNGPVSRSASDVQLSFKTGRAIERAILFARLTAILPFRAAEIPINVPGFVAGFVDTRPIVCGSDRVQFAIMNDQRADTPGFAVADTAAIKPFLF